MGRDREDRDRLYGQFEGLAVQQAARLWQKWRGGLRGTALGREDLLQEARAILLELCATMDLRRRPPRCRAWVMRSVRGRLFNLIRRQVYCQPTVTSCNLDNIPADFPRFSLISPEILLTLRREDREFCERMLAGDTEKEACLAMGWTQADQRGAMGRIRQLMEENL